MTTLADARTGAGQALGADPAGRAIDTTRGAKTMGRESIGELEHLILLAVAALGADACALEIRRRLDAEGRRITRGALYRALDRLGEKDLIAWEVEEPDPERGGHPRRLYDLSPEGVEILRERRATLERLWADAARVVR